MGEDEVQLEKSSMENQHQSQELLVPSGEEPSQPEPSDGAPSHHLLVNADLEEGHELSAITVLTLLDQLVKMLDGVQEKQLRMEQWQQEMDGSVKRIQNDMNKLLKSNSGAVNNVSKLLEKNRKISAVMKDVRDKMERQGAQVRKLEDNHAYLMHRDNFRVLIFQDEKEIPSTVFLKDPPHDPENDSLSPDPNRSHEEDLHVVQLSSDEDLDEEDDDDFNLEMMENLEKSRAEKIKSSSLKKVDSLKRAFTRENFEKKMNKIVSAEKRDKIKKSLSQKNKGGSFKIFKKIREGEEPAESFSEIHAELAPDQEEQEEEAPEKKDVEKEEVEKEEMEKEDADKEARPDDSGEAEPSTEGVSDEYALSDTLPQDSSRNAPEDGEEEKQEEQKEKEEGGEDEGGAAKETS
ncbi:caveolae-associated protein 2b [Trichomycterus rosablanca]|uniref:caveolae-associated protein 2b n=1 Tax=Trichomycterus rosablanca TaxID=2290929 RepID=UPI002F3597E3